MKAGTSAGEATVSWRIKLRSGFTLVELVGDMNENADLRPLGAELKGNVVFNLSAVGRINSSGTREWINFMRELPEVRDIALSHCSPAVVQQLNAIHNFRGRATVRSVLVPFACDRCLAQTDKLMSIEPALKGPPSLPEVHCPQCGGAMEFEELVERYFQFLQDQR